MNLKSLFFKTSIYKFKKKLQYFRSLLLYFKIFFTLFFIFQLVGCYIYYKQENLNPESATSSTTQDSDHQNNQNDNGNANGNSNSNNTEVPSIPPIPFHCSNYLTDSRLDLKGSGITLDPYVICNAYQLLELSKPASTTFLNKVFELQNDIDMAVVSSEFVPIGTTENPFRGKIFGNKKTINNWTTTLTSPNAGLFGVSEKALFKNINLENINISHGTNHNVGALLGLGLLNSKVEHIHGTKINITGNGANVGGVVGSINGGVYDVILENNISISVGTIGKSASALAADANVGGVVGEVNHTLMNMLFGFGSFVEKAIVSQATIESQIENTGGLIGRIYSDGSTGFAQIKNTKLKNSIVHGNYFVGGIAGETAFTQIVLSQVDSNTDILGIGSVGGIAGSSSSDTYYDSVNYYNASEAWVKGQSNVGGDIWSVILYEFILQLHFWCYRRQSRGGWTYWIWACC